MPASLSRRQFLQGCSAAIAALAGSRLTQVAFADPAALGATNREILVVVFLRGAWDALHVFPPTAGADRGYYETARSNYLRYAPSGTGGALALGSVDGPNGVTGIGLHPSMAPLLSLYQARRAAFVLACGMHSPTRSHFDAMAYMELGTPDVKTTPSGWITRHLQTATNLPAVVQLPALSAGSSQPASLLAFPSAVAMSGPASFRFNGSTSNFVGGRSYSYWQQQSLRQMYSGSTWLDAAGVETLDTLDLVQSVGTYAPANGAQYPAGSFGDNLKAIAQMIKLGAGLQTATIDFGGWDTHEFQGSVASGSNVPYIAGLLDQLARGLAAFYTDLDGCGPANYTSRLTVVVMSEFGRRLRENASQGTDHGHGSAMIVLGGGVFGGRLYGQWPGLRNDQLFQNADLQVTTDYRQVLSEILVRRMGNPNLAQIFPDYAGYTPLNIVSEAEPVANGPNKIYMPTVIQGAGRVCP
jgi:uncharacterized protein (DUF1501 family)